MAVENFTTYTEVDPNSRIAITSTRVTWTDLARNEDAYVYDDKGANHFNGDFEHLLTINITAGDVSSSLFSAIWLIANEVDDLKGIRDNAATNALALEFYYTGTTPRLFLLENIGSNNANVSSSFTITLGTVYYLKIVRDESVGTYGTLYCYIYSDSSRNTLLDTLSLTLTVKNNFRYIYPIASFNAANANKHSGYTENLSLSAGPSGSSTVTTGECTNTTATSTTGWGYITVLGDGAPTQHGHVWSTNRSPSTSDSKTELGAKPQTGSFTSNITSLTPNTTYYIRAYAINTAGTNYGAEVNITTGTTIGKRFIWTESNDFHYFDAYGIERVLQGHAVASDKDIWPWLDPFS